MIYCRARAPFMILCLVAAVFLAGCMSYENTHATITVKEVRQGTDSRAFSCYLEDSNGVTYRVKYEPDCVRFRNNSGASYFVEQNYEQMIVFADRSSFVVDPPCAHLVRFNFSRTYDPGIESKTNLIVGTTPVDNEPYQIEYDGNNIMTGTTDSSGSMVVALCPATKGLIATTTRFFMLYGPGESPSDYRSAVVRFIDAAMKGEPLRVHAGTKRQWCHIDDAVRLLVQIVERKQMFNYEVYNVGNSIQVPTIDLAREIVMLVGSTSKILDVPVEKTIIPVKLASFEKMKEVFGWTAQRSLHRGLKEVYQDIGRYCQ